MNPIPYQYLSEAVHRHGLSLAAVVNDLTPLGEAEGALAAWQQAGFAGDLNYMLRPSAGFGDLRRLLPDVRSAVVLAARYPAREREPLPVGFGRVARYAWGRDYHRVVKRRIEGVVQEIRSLTGGFEYRIFTDAVPLLERAFARQAGLGFIGKNTMLIRPGVGSYLFLAELLLTVEVEAPPCLEVRERCGSCTRCMERCPAGAFPAPRVLDARRCIAYLTIEKRGWLDPAERESLGEWVFGCDRCQEVCPFNTRAARSAPDPDITEFAAPAGAGPVLDLQEVLALRSQEAFTGRFAGLPLMRAGREGLVRNAAAVAGNTQAYAAGDRLMDAASADPSAVVRGHALWALGKLLPGMDGRQRGRARALVETARSDENELVSEEARRACGDDPQRE